jgi:threonylcarbamoyladenosine tRNA methylthiotransferase MtaB
VPRVRLSSIDPPEVTTRLLDLMARSNALCPHLHIPVQAGDDAVLRRMRRKYDAALLSDLGAEIRAQLPDAAIGTDVIAGFPGETDAQFDATISLLDALPLTYFHVFPYSRRTGTTAAKLPEHLPAACIKQRAQRLRRLGERKRAEFAKRFVGAEMPVLVEHTPVRDTGRLTGYTRNYQRVEFAGSLDLANREVAVKISAAYGARLLGRLSAAHVDG